MKTIVIYYSNHHNNTEKLIQVLKEKNEVTLINVEEAQNIDLKEYDLIGFASGIYAGNFSEKILSYINEKLSNDKLTFLVYTSAVVLKSYKNKAIEDLKKKNATILGVFGCRGYNTFGPFKLIGGTGRNKPDQEDQEKLENFFENIESNAELILEKKKPE